MGAFSLFCTISSLLSQNELMLEESQTSRITSLLKIFNLQSQYCSGVDEIINALQNNIDYSFTHIQLEEEQRKSRLFLDGALNEIEKNIKS